MIQANQYQAQLRDLLTLLNNCWLRFRNTYYLYVYRFNHETFFIVLLQIF